MAFQTWSLSYSLDYLLFPLGQVKQNHPQLTHFSSQQSLSFFLLAPSKRFPELKSTQPARKIRLKTTIEKNNYLNYPAALSSKGKAVFPQDSIALMEDAL